MRAIRGMARASVLAGPYRKLEVMPTCNTVATVHDLLALAEEIAQQEPISIHEGMHRALVELPRLTSDVTQNVRYPPAQHVHPKPVTRWRPVTRPCDEHLNMRSVDDGDQ